MMAGRTGNVLARVLLDDFSRSLASLTLPAICAAAVLAVALATLARRDPTPDARLYVAAAVPALLMVGVLWPQGVAWFHAAVAAAAVIAASGSNVTVFHAIQSASRVVPAPLFEAFWQSVTYAGDGLAVFALAAVVLWQRPDAAWAGMIAAVPGSVALNGLKALI